VRIDVKIAVAERQLRDRGIVAMFPAETGKRPNKARMLLNMLRTLLGEPPWHLDHEPPLMLRDRTRDGGYLPDAGDADWLIWRTAEEHRLKTFVRGDGAQLSDAGKRRKEIKRKRKATKPKRSWPKGRKLRSRPLR